MKIAEYLDSTYLKTAEQAGISEQETKEKVVDLVNEAIQYQFKLVMIRKEFVALAKNLIRAADSEVLVGTVIGFHEGSYGIKEKLDEAQYAIEQGVDELDYVINYKAFKGEQINLVKSEIYQCTKLGLDNDKVVKWIIEIAALNDDEIALITALIRDTVLENFGEDHAKQVYVKSSTGFFKTDDGSPNGATVEGIKIMAENSGPLPIKAAGGVRNADDVKDMLNLGVTRFGTSSAKAIYEGNQADDSY